jgi:hypothetical protein
MRNLLLASAAALGAAPRIASAQHRNDRHGDVDPERPAFAALLASERARDRSPS